MAGTIGNIFTIIELYSAINEPFPYHCLDEEINQWWCEVIPALNETLHLSLNPKIKI